MQIRIRYIDDARSIYFDDAPFDQLDEIIITFVKRSGGFYYNDSQQPFHSYQLVNDGDGAYCEIIIGDDGND